MAQISWKVSGYLRVEDFLIPNTILGEDELSGTDVVERPLRGVKVQVKASTHVNGRFSSWGTEVTGDDGYFEITQRKNEKPRKFQVLVELNDSDLSVRSKANVKERLTIYQSRSREDAPDIDLGQYVLRSGDGGNVSISTQWKALTWYICKCVMTTFKNDSTRSAFKRKVRVRVPANTIGGAPWARGIGNDNVYIMQDTFNLVTIIHEIMHVWNYQHNYGITNWIAAVWGDSDTSGNQENPNVAFHEGFAEFAAWELMHLIWGIPKGLPYSRHELMTTRSLSSLSMVEKNWRGVASYLRMMTAYNPAALVVGVAGDLSGEYASETGDTTGCPTGQLVTFFDVLRVFSKGGGWKTEWQVTNKSYGVRRFFRRASDILDTFSDSASQLMLDTIDPAGTVEIGDSCDDLLTDVDQNARRRMRARRAKSATSPSGTRSRTETIWRHPVRAKAGEVCSKKTVRRKTKKKTTRKRLTRRG